MLARHRNVTSRCLAGLHAKVFLTCRAVVIGSADFPESELLAEIYAGALTAKGIEASTRPRIGSREIYLKALEDGSIQAVPEYTGALGFYYAKEKFVETDPAQLVRSLDDLDVAVINGIYALEANLSPSKDAILVEDAEGNPYANFLAVQESDKDNASLKKLDELLHSPEVKAFIEKTWSDGSVLAAA